MYKRKDGRWEDTVNIDGQIVHIYGRTQAEVRKKAAQRRKKEADKLLLSVIANDWYEWKEPQVRYNTSKGYKAPVKDIQWYFEGAYIQDVTPKMVNDFLKTLAKQRYAKTTVQHRLNTLSMIYSYAVSELELDVVNPCSDIELPKHLPEGRRELPPDSDLAIIEQHVDDSRFTLLLYFLTKTGMRIGEALAVTNQSFQGDRIVVTEQAQWIHNQAVISPVKTDRGVRKIPYLKVLRDHVPTFKGYLFSEDGTKPFSFTQFDNRMRQFRKATGLVSTPHQLRHFFATAMFNAKIDSKVAATIMGHDERVMREIYTHIQEANIQEAADKLDSLWPPPSSNRQ